MKENRTSSKKSYFQIESNGGEQLARRRTNLTSDGAYFFEVDLNVKGVFDTTVIICTAWLIEFFQLNAGEVFFLCGEKDIRPATKHFGVYYPPFSIVRTGFANPQGRVLGIAAAEALPAELKIAPILFETTFTEPPMSAAQAIEILRAGANRQPIKAYPKASLLSLKAKKLIDQNYLAYPSIARVAARLKVSHAHLSRQFKQDFEMNPSDYLRRLRLADAQLLLARGEAIIDVSQAVGYNDLSRFYKQFRQTNSTSPGICQTIMRPN